MSAFISEQPNRAWLFAERRNDGVSVRGEERSRKRYAVRDDESAFTSEQQRRSVAFFGDEEQEKRADVTRCCAGRSLAIFATTRVERSRKRYADRENVRLTITKMPVR